MCVKCLCIEHEKPVVDVLDFLKIMIDWIVDNDIGKSDDPMTLVGKFPTNDLNGDIYFYNPMR